MRRGELARAAPSRTRRSHRGKFMPRWLALVAVSATARARAGPGPTCCTSERRCCSQTWAPPASHECERNSCCDRACATATLDTVLAFDAVTRARNPYGLKLSADCCDVFSPDGSLCRRDLRGNCSAARRCARFKSDCGRCDTFCEAFAEA
mmetsp:Transcript_11104/g.34187  ORF Transcript_11104/g.34187 Transcript_11104/m.34187 type:complete len:151 (-) Transcript_11104:24-476(-)